MDTPPPTVGRIAETIARLAESAGMTLAALADAACIKRRTLRRRMADAGSFLVSELERIADVLNVSVATLFDG